MRYILNKIGEGDGTPRAPWIKTVYLSCLACPDDYLAVDLAIAPPIYEVIEIVKGPPLGYGCDNIATWAKKYYKPVDGGTGELIPMTIATAYESLQRKPNEWETELLQYNIGHSEWSCAAMIIGLNCIHPKIVNYMYDKGMFRIPLIVWKDTFGGWFESLKRCGRIRGLEELLYNDIVLLRKIMMCTARVKQQADWDLEFDRRTEGIPLHYLPNDKGEWVEEIWKENTQRKSDELAKLIINGMCDGPTLDSIQEWWNARWAHASDGSSTLRFLLNDYTNEDDRLMSKDRPGKKACWEALPDNFAEYVIKDRGIRGYMRTSTRVHAGLKWRAVYAMDDINTIMASYASVHMEKFMNVWGIKAKQAPADVVEWLVIAKTINHNETWLSIDYTDFNHEHTLYNLVGFNLSLAKAWRESNLIPQIKNEKAIAATKVGLSHYVSLVHGAGDHDYRWFGTLASGHRDTARDNSALHGIYSKVISDSMSMYDSKCTPRSTFFTGDDEDAIHYDFISAAHYMLGHSLANFTLNPSKQMAGWNHHEFLQREVLPDGMPIMPLFAMLAQWCSGNWEHSVRIWYDNAISATSETAWDLHVRGMPIVMARRLAASQLNAAMRIPSRDGSGYKELEWWQFRHGETITPLWYGLEGKSFTTPKLDKEVIPLRSAAKNASLAWINSRCARTHIQLSEQDKSMLIDRCSALSYSSLFTNARADKGRREAVEIWPERISHIPYQQFSINNITPFNHRDMIERMSMAESRRRPNTIDEVLSRFGLDSMITQALGGISKVLRGLPPRLLGKYENPVDIRGLPISMRYIDGAVQSWIANARAVDVGMPENRDYRYGLKWHQWLKYDDEVVPHNTLMPVILKVWIAPNASGKSTYAHTHKGVLDMDDAVRKAGLRGSTNSAAKLRSDVMDEQLATSLEWLIARSGSSELVTQWNPDRWLLHFSKRGWRADITIIDIDNNVLETRMMARGWDNSKIERRLGRWVAILSAAKSKFTTSTRKLSEGEKEHITFAKQFPINESVDNCKVINTYLRDL